MSYSVEKALHLYGFKSAAEKNAFENLFKNALSVNSISSVFPEVASFNELARDLLTLVKVTQKYFVNRSGTQERWEVNWNNDTTKWMQTYSSENSASLKTLNITDAIIPQNMNPDIICILGATKASMTGRFNYATKLVEDGLNFKQIVLSAGERYATAKADGDLTEIANYFQLSSIEKVTETHIIKHLFDHSIFNSSPVQVMDTPRGNLPRPTTQTTMIDLSNWLKENDYLDKKVLFISSQPNVLYQKAIITQVLRSSDTDIDFEVVGANYNGESIQPAIAALGSYLYAQTPNVLIMLNETISEYKVIELFNEIYSSQPLIYEEALANKLIGLISDPLINGQDL